MIDIMLEPLMDFEWDSSQIIPQWNRNGPEVSRPMFCLEGTLSRLSVLKTRITCFSINIKMKMKEKVLFSLKTRNMSPFHLTSCPNWTMIPSKALLT